MASLQGKSTAGRWAEVGGSGFLLVASEGDEIMVLNPDGQGGGERGAGISGTSLDQLLNITDQERAESPGLEMENHGTPVTDTPPVGDLAGCIVQSLEVSPFDSSLCLAHAWHPTCRRHAVLVFRLHLLDSPADISNLRVQLLSAVLVREKDLDTLRWHKHVTSSQDWGELEIPRAEDWNPSSLHCSFDSLSPRRVTYSFGHHGIIVSMDVEDSTTNYRQAHWSVEELGRGTALCNAGQLGCLIGLSGGRIGVWDTHSESVDVAAVSPLPSPCTSLVSWRGEGEIERKEQFLAVFGRSVIVSGVVRGLKP